MQKPKKQDTKPKTQDNTEINDALNVVKKVCSEFNGSLKDHQIIQNSIRVLENKLLDTN